MQWKNDRAKDVHGEYVEGDAQTDETGQHLGGKENIIDTQRRYLPTYLCKARVLITSHMFCVAWPTYLPTYIPKLL